jgi:hypothetical protein
MSYSTQVRHDYAKFVRAHGATIDIAEFVRLYWNRGQGAKLEIPKAMDAAFADPQSDGERKIRTLIGNDLKRTYVILDDRERPYYEHRLAA